MDIKKEERDNQLIYYLTGRLDTLFAEELDKDLRDTSTDGIEELIIDMGNVVYISSQGLRVLMLENSAMTRQGKRLVLRNLNDNCKEIFRVMGLREMFLIQ